MPLSAAKKKHYRSLAHSLHPIVTIAGNGLSESVNAEIERALEDHELIKIKIVFEDKADRKAVVEELNRTHRCETVQQIGKVAVLFRQAKKPSPSKSNLA